MPQDERLLCRAEQGAISNHFDRTMRLHRNGFRDTSEQVPQYASTAVRADDNQVGTPVSCQFDDSFLGNSINDGGFDCDTGPGYDFARTFNSVVRFPGVLFSYCGSNCTGGKPRISRRHQRLNNTDDPYLTPCWPGT